MSITLKGGPFDGVVWPNNRFPRCPELIGFTDNSEDGMHIYSTNGPSDTVGYDNSIDSGELREIIKRGIKSGDIIPVEFDHYLTYEGVVKRDSVPMLYQQSLDRINNDPECRRIDPKEGPDAEVQS